MLIVRGLLGSSFAFASSAQAAIPSTWDAHAEVQDRVGDGSQQFMVVPRQIRAEQVRLFRNFMGGRVYSAPHHHYHTVYRLPIDTGHGVIYRPYFYCGDTLQVALDVSLPRLAIRVQIGSSEPVYDSPVIVHAPPAVVVTSAAYVPPSAHAPACHAPKSNRGHHYGWKNKQDRDEERDEGNDRDDDYDSDRNGDRD